MTPELGRRIAFTVGALLVYRLGSYIPLPGVDPVDGIISRTTLVGAVYLASVCLIPEILPASARVPFYLAGTSLLIVVCAVMDLEAQMRGQARIGGGLRP